MSGVRFKDLVSLLQKTVAGLPDGRTGKNLSFQCPCCSHLEHKSGEITYYHSAVTPVIVAPGRPEVIALRPEFITPQDGHTMRAAK